ncbi:MAG: hypothetical protein JO267_03870 [Alphaproteobacteria bacterium]|nr:hypothetical protein [Alphaproteobacteria bacterium]
MRASAIPLLLSACLILPVAGIAQTLRPGTPPPAPAPAPAAPGTATPGGGITRDEYIQRAQERAGRAAGTRFDEMDANHDGVLTPDEIRAYRATHPRGRRGRSSSSPSEQ